MCMRTPILLPSQHVNHMDLPLVDLPQRIDPNMPVILEHLDTDEQYLKYLDYLKRELDGLYLK